MEYFGALRQVRTRHERFRVRLPRDVPAQVIVSCTNVMASYCQGHARWPSQVAVSAKYQYAHCRLLITGPAGTPPVAAIVPLRDMHVAPPAIAEALARSYRLYPLSPTQRPHSHIELSHRLF